MSMLLGGIVTGRAGSDSAPSDGSPDYDPGCNQDQILDDVLALKRWRYGHYGEALPGEEE